MNEQSQDLKELLLQTDEEFHQLADQHHELEDRLHELTAKHYLSEPEQVEEVTLKKRSCSSRTAWKTSLRHHRTPASLTLGRHGAQIRRARPRDRAFVRFAPVVTRYGRCRMRIDPAGLPVHRRRAGRWPSLAGAFGVAGWRCRSLVLAGVLPRSSSAIPIGTSRGQRRRACCRRPTAACWSPARPMAERGAAGRRGSRSASSCRRWTCTSTACRSSGRVTQVSYTPGRFLPAYRHEAATANERSEIWIDHAGQTIVARQIVGILARRVVCRVAAGREVQAGDRFGIMKFGSRMDVFLPPTARRFACRSATMVRGGETVIAVLH